MEQDRISIFVTGTAGSGKTALTQAYHEWLKERGLDVALVNLDPGVELLPYVPDVDVRDWINVKDVMSQYGVGPNGAQIISADLLAVEFREIVDVLEEFKSQFILIDTPGQIELFAFRQASRVFLESLGEASSVILFLFDPVLSSTPSGFVSLLLLSASVQFRFQSPFLNVLSKSDILGPDKLEKVVGWSSGLETLYDSLMGESTNIRNEASIELFKALEELGTFSRLIPASSKTYAGLEDIYTSVQNSFFGGEDIYPD